MPEKKLIANDLIHDGEVCAIGAVGARRGVDMTNLDPDDSDTIAATFGIARQLVCEIEYLNDEAGWRDDTPERRWQRIRDWAVAKLLPIDIVEIET